MTGDEKLVVYNSIKRKRSWSKPGEPAQTTSTDIHQKKSGGITKELVYFELLPPNRTINSDVYIEQLTKLNNAVEEKRPELTNRKGVFFANKNQKFYERGIMMLPERWQKVIDKNGQYITE
ncbi:transposase [Cooperia oncophora]